MLYSLVMDFIIFDQKIHSYSPRQMIVQWLLKIQFQPLNLKRQYLYFSGLIILNRLRQSLSVIIEAKIISAKEIILTLSLNPANSQFSTELMNNFIKRKAEITHFIHITNHQRLNQREGTFHIQQQTGNISFKTIIRCISMLTSKQKQKTVITSHLRKAVKNYSQTIENIVFYYRLRGYNLSQLPIMLQQQNTFQLKLATEKIILLKSYFDQNPQKNEKFQHYFRLIRKTLALMRGVNSLDTLIMSNIRPESYKNIVKEFEAQEKMLKKNMNEFQKLKFCSILTSIDILHTAYQLPLYQGKYSKNTYGLYDFIALFSVHDQVNNEVAQQLANKEKERTACCLVKKVSLLQNQSVSEPIQNQIHFLRQMKSKVCPYFAKYYCKKSPNPFADGQIYLQYYPNDLDQTKLREESRIKVLQDVCMGLFFLSNQQILHRDLKQKNIMIDRNKRARIIDFGSVAPFSTSQKFITQDKIQVFKLRSTDKYYYPFENLSQNQPKIYNLYTKDEYQRHPNFDIYSLGRIISKQFSLEMCCEQGEFIRHFLHHLSKKCLEANPAKRWTISQVLLFIRQILIYFQLHNQFWKYGFQKAWKAHVPGTIYQIRQYSYQQRLFEQGRGTQR